MKHPPFCERKGAQIILNLHPGQTEAMEALERFVFMFASTQGGKTCLGPWWLKQEIDARGPGDYLAVTATFPLLNLKMLPEFLYVFDHLLKLGTYRSSDKVFEFTYNKQWQDKWPGREDVKTRVIFASAANSESIESATALAAWLDEVGQLQFHRASWEAILRRLSLAQGRVLAHVRRLHQQQPVLVVNGQG